MTGLPARQGELPSTFGHGATRDCHFATSLVTVLGRLPYFEIVPTGELEDGGRLSYIEQSCYPMSMRSHVPRAKIRAQSPALGVILLAILVMLSAMLGWLGGLVAWLIVLGALAVFAFCLRARP